MSCRPPHKRYDTVIIHLFLAVVNPFCEFFCFFFKKSSISRRRAVKKPSFARHLGVGSLTFYSQDLLFILQTSRVNNPSVTACRDSSASCRRQSRRGSAAYPRHRGALRLYRQDSFVYTKNFCVNNPSVSLRLPPPLAQGRLTFVPPRLFCLY